MQSALPSVLRFVLCVAVVIYFILVLHYLKSKMLELRYTLIWLFAGGVMGIMVFFPHVLTFICRLMGIQSNMNGLFVLAIGFVLLVLMTLTSIASRTTMKIRTLIQEISILDKRLRELEEAQENIEDEG